jgi:hypothetical protein
MGYHGYVAVQSRGTIAIPAELRRRYHLDSPGAQVEITELANGVWEIRPAVAVSADQAWFWSPEWQQMEREADEDIAAGRDRRFDSDEEFLAWVQETIDTLDAEDQTSGRPAS